MEYVKVGVSGWLYFGLLLFFTYLAWLPEKLQRFRYEGNRVKKLKARNVRDKCNHRRPRTNIRSCLFDTTNTPPS